MKATNRFTNHDLFTELCGAECLEICRASLLRLNRSMKPRVPSVTYLESFRPNYAKYFKQAGYGECSTCKPAYDNYIQFTSLCRELNPTLKFPTTVSIFVRERVCKDTTGQRRQDCEDNICRRCTFTNYFVEDKALSKAKMKLGGSLKTFSDEFEVQFLYDTMVCWNEMVSVGDELPGGRKYEHIIYKSVEGPVSEFLLEFQRQCSALKPHKFYQHACEKRKSLSKMVGNKTLLNDRIAIYADYSQNFKKCSGKSGVALQYRDRPEVSLLNLCCFLRLENKVIRVDYHCISDDPKHDTCLWPASLKMVTLDLLKRHPNTEHFEITTDTSRKEFKSVSVFQRIAQISKEIKKSFMICTFGPDHGKFLYDSAGSDWVDWYNRSCVGTLTTDANDLKKVAVFMNKVHGKPSTKTVDLSFRVTLVVPPVIHILSEYESIPGTTCNFCFLIDPINPEGIYVRRYWCGHCSACKKLDFLGCTREECGQWNFNLFKLKSGRKKKKRKDVDDEKKILIEREVLKEIQHDDNNMKSRKKRTSACASMQEARNENAVAPDQEPLPKKRRVKQHFIN